MNLLMFNLAADAEHVTLAFGLRWVEALAQQFDHIDLVTMYEGRHRLPSNVKVWSVGREQGYSKLRRVLRFYWLVLAILAKRRPAVVFSHMIPLFSVLFWPIARLIGLPSVLWYAHGATPPMLRLAHRMVNRVVSSTPEGFRLRSRKIVFIGQGVDAALFPYRPHGAKGSLRLITVGRVAPSKGQDRLIAALAGWQPASKIAWHLTIVGDATSERERAYLRQVECSARKLLPSGCLTFTGRLNSNEIAPYLADSDLFVSLGTTGSLDKAIVEAMVSGCPVISCNDAFRTIAEREGFGECAIEDSVQALREAFDAFCALSDQQRSLLTDAQATVARRDHILDGLILRLTAVLRACAKDGR